MLKAWRQARRSSGSARGKTDLARSEQVALATALVRSAARELESRLEGSSHYVGIDLGTTNSAAAIVDVRALLAGDLEQGVRLVPVRQEGANGATYSPLLPSVVAEVSPGEWQVGQGAKEARQRGLLRGRQIFYSTKSEMGLGREPYYPFASRDLDSPYKVAGCLLAELRAAVEEEAGPEALETAIVTVPASFQLAARKDTFRAAGLADMQLTERSLLDEPNAALLDYLLTCGPRGNNGSSFDFSTPRTVLVFDFGGGTCDVSILRVQADGRADGWTSPTSPSPATASSVATTSTPRSSSTCSCPSS
jgi:molecular chaperone DnaK (HSP70)